MPRLSDTGIRRAVAGVTNGHQITPQNFASEDGMMTFSRASDDDMMSGIISYPADGQVHRSPRGRPRKKSKSDVTKTDTPEQDSPSGQRRRGRPPGAKNKNTTKPGNPMMIPTRTKPSGNSVNTPSGLRNAMTPSDGVAIVIGAGSSAVPHSSKERSRHSLSRQPSTPQHKIYRCRWRDCPFELHNLETLRKHVYKHRDQFSHSPFPCLWTNCGTIVISDEKETDDRENLHFENEDDWIEHMNGKHIDHYAWELGDGPSAHPSGKPTSIPKQETVLTNPPPQMPKPQTTSATPAEDRSPQPPAPAALPIPSISPPVDEQHEPITTPTATSPKPTRPAPSWRPSRPKSARRAWGSTAGGPRS